MASDEASLLDSLGAGSVLHPGVEVLVENRQGDGRGIFVGSACIIYPRNRLVLGDMGANPAANMTIGDHVLINAGGYISGEGGLVIGDYVMIGPHASVLSAGHRYGDPAKLIQRQGLTYGEITIGRDAWLGAGSIVLEGISIGEGAVVGAGTVVCRDVPAGAVVVGNPGRIIKYRGKSAEASGSRLFTRFFRHVQKVLGGN